MTAEYIQMIVALGAVIGLMLLLTFFLKKKQAKTGLPMNVVAYHSFGPRKGVAALKVGKDVLLLGITSTDVRLLKTFRENDFEQQTAAEINDKLRMLKGLKDRLHEHK